MFPFPPSRLKSEAVLKCPIPTCQQEIETKMVKEGILSKKEVPKLIFHEDNNKINDIHVFDIELKRPILQAIKLKKKSKILSRMAKLLFTHTNLIRARKRAHGAAKTLLRNKIAKRITTIALNSFLKCRSK